MSTLELITILYRFPSMQAFSDVLGNLYASKSQAEFAHGNLSERDLSAASFHMSM